jgi:hypothetical protein
LLAGQDLGAPAISRRWLWSMRSLAASVVFPIPDLLGDRRAILPQNNYGMEGDAKAGVPPSGH